MKRALLLLCLGVMALVVWYGLKGRGPSPEGVATQADLALEGVRYVEVKGGRPRWELEARRVEHWLSEEVTRAEDLKVVFYLEDGRKVTARADEGAVKRGGEGFVELRGRVRLESDDGWSLETDFLRYETEEEVVRTSAPVRIEGKGLELTGVGLEVMLDTQRLLILRDVEATVQEG